MAITISKPTVGASTDTWGTTINTALDTIVDGMNGTSGTIAPDLSTLTINGTDVTATAVELNYMDGVTSNVQTQLDSVAFPSGGIIMWSGAVADIPSGWVLCDGNNGTPNLRNKFVVGAGATYSVDDTGGSATTTLTTANLPAHTHTFSGNTNTASLTGSANNIGEPFGAYGNTSGIFSKGSSSSGGTPQNTDTSSTGQLNIDASHSHSFSGNTGSSGSGNSFDILPPYYALAYIMKT